jgi:multicomponent Na+:H+ antiporter subunit D
VTLTEHFPVLAVVVTLFGAYLSPWVAYWRRRAVGWFAAGVCAAALAQAVAMLVRAARDGTVHYHLGGWAPPVGIELAVTPASALVAVVVAGVAGLVAVYSTVSLQHEVASKGHGWYGAAFLLVVAGMLGLLVTNDLFNIFVMMEITTLGAVGLVVARDRWGAAEAGLRYLLLASLGSTLILFGIGMVYMITGHLNLGYIAAELGRVWAVYPHVAAASLALMGLGFALKAALFPLHVWLPEAHTNAPSSSSAVLSGLVVKAYSFTLLRLTFVVFRPLLEHALPVRQALVAAACGAILGGSLFALVQVELKRVLAYGTVAQLGYIFLGVGLGTPSGVVAAFFQIVSHAITKACLFMCAGIIIEQTGRRRVADMGGLGRALPLTTAAFTVCALSMIGIPLLSGFVVKWYLVQAGLEVGQPWFVLLVLASGLLNAAYYLPVVWRFYFQPSNEPLPDRRPLFDPAAWPQPGWWRRAIEGLEAPWPALLPALALSLACIVLGVWTSPLVDYLGGVAGWLLGATTP